MNYLLNGEESERLTFRLLEENDFPSWLEFCRDEDSFQYLWITDKTDPEAKCRAWFDRIFYRYSSNLGGMNVLIEKKSGAFVGQCGLLIHTVDGVEELEIGYSIMPAFRGKGFATEAARKCRDFAFANNFRESLISIIHEDNVRSEKVARKNGMDFEKRTLYNNRAVKIYRIHKYPAGR